MPKLDFDRWVPFSPDQMFGLVADLDSYPLFVPNCSHMVVKRDHSQPGDIRFARMTIRFGPIKQAYTSRVVSDESAGTIRAHSTDGPFSHLDSEWRFEPSGEGTHVHFKIDFAISNPLIASVAEPAFAHKQEEIVDAFIARAERLYGRSA